MLFPACAQGFLFDEEGWASISALAGGLAVLQTLLLLYYLYRRGHAVLGDERYKADANAEIGHSRGGTELTSPPAGTEEGQENSLEKNPRPALSAEVEKVCRTYIAYFHAMMAGEE